MSKDSFKLIANNKKAYHDYFIEDKYEAGIELFGTEVKSIRMGKCSIKEAYIRIEHGEVFIHGMHVNPYEKGNIFNRDPLRVRKLLMHRMEIRRLESKIAQKGYTLVRFRSILREVWRRWKLALHAARSSMTSGRTLRRRTRSERFRGSLSRICGNAWL